MATSLDTDILAELINQKHDLLSQIRELSRQQATLIDQGDVTQVLGILSTKQKRITDLQNTERMLAPFRDQDPDQREWRSMEDRLRCRQVAERCAALLEEIMLMEKQGESELLERRNKAAARLDSSHNAASARRAYMQTGSRNTSRLDINST